MIKIGWQEILDLCLGKSSIKKVLSKDVNDNNELIFVSLKDANINCDSKTYNNQKQFPENVIVELDGNVLVENRDYIINNNIGWTNAGIYELKIEGIDPYRKSAVFKFIINKITPTLINPIANTQLEYNGNNQALITVGSVDYGTLQYSLDGINYSTNEPTAINAGEYTVYYKVVGDSNINNIEPNSLSINISKKTILNPTITFELNTFEYNGSEIQPIPIVKDGNIIIDSNEYTITYDNNINAGIGTCIITNNEGGNYIVNGSIEFNISKLTHTLIAPTAKVLTYNTDAQELIIAGSVNYGTLQYSLDGINYDTNIPIAIDAGTYTIHYRASANENYDAGDDQSLQTTVEKAPTSIELATDVTDDGLFNIMTLTVELNKNEVYKFSVIPIIILNGHNHYLVNEIGKPIIGLESSFTSIVSILNSNWKPYNTTSNQDSECLEVNIAAGNTDGRSTITVSLGSGINHTSSVKSFTVIVGNGGSGGGSGGGGIDDPGPQPYDPGHPIDDP